MRRQQGDGTPPPRARERHPSSLPARESMSPEESEKEDDGRAVPAGGTGAIRKREEEEWAGGEDEVPTSPAARPTDAASGTPLQTPEAKARPLYCAALGRLGTPAQTYRRKKRPKFESVEEGAVAMGDDFLSAGGGWEGEGRARDGGAAGAGAGGGATADSDGVPIAAAPAKLRQVYLDLGQSTFGHTKCPVCGLLYTVGEPSDERTHKQFHKKFLSERAATGAFDAPKPVPHGQQRAL